MRLFKYLARRHLEAFLKRGTLRIGTLLEYRRTEKYGLVIGDSNEGRHKTELSLPGKAEIDLGQNTPEAEFFRKHVLRLDQQNSKVKIVLEDGAKLVAHSNSQDLYLYCASAEYDADVMREFGCDSCLEIVHPDRFFTQVSRRIRHKANFDGCGGVTYCEKHTHYSRPHKLHPAVMKDTEYAYQKEWRAIWIPKRPTAEPLIIDAPRAIQYCSVYKP